MKNPARHLASHSPGALVPVTEFKPHQQKGHEWQADAFVYNRLVAEVGYLHDTTAKLVAACDLPVLEDVEDPRTALVTSKPAEDPRVNRVMRALIGPVGGRKELMRRAAFHYQVAGESILAAIPLKDDLGQMQGYSWEFLSPREIKTETKMVQGQQVTTVFRQSGSDDDNFLPIDASLARWWRSDPEYSARADSPMRRVLPICRELVILSEVVDAIAKSRLNAGILKVPDELGYGADDESQEEGSELDGMNKLIQDLIEHMTAPVEDRSSAASLVPLIVSGPAEFLEKLDMLWLSRDFDKTYQDLRKELLIRIAQGLDAPPELLQGKASLNHWSAYSVDNEFVDRHVAPLGEALAEFLTVSYLRRMLVLHEGMTPEEASRYRIVFDPRPLAQRDDEAELAAGGWDRVILSDRAWLSSNGFTEADMPDDDERKRRLLEKLVLSAPGIYGPAILPVLYPELQGVVDSAIEADQAQRQRNQAEGPATPQAGDPIDAPQPVDGGGPANGIPDGGPPTERPDGSAPAQQSISAEDALAERLATAAHAALLRAMEKEASKILSRMNGKNPELRTRLSDVRKSDVLAQMSNDDLSAIGVEANGLFNDAWDSFSQEAEVWMQDWATSTGAAPFLAREVSKAAVKNMCQALDFLARSGVGQAIPVSSNGLRIPDSLVRRSIHRAMEDIAARS